MGESPEQFTNYWLSRFPLLLVHTWIVMQCVAHETVFSQYYPSKYRYPELDYSPHESDNSNDSNKEAVVESIEERADFMGKKNPRRQQKVSFYEYRNKHFGRQRESSAEENKMLGVGLYRNLSANDSVLKLCNDNISTKPKNRARRSPNIRHKPKKQAEEPLNWNVPDK